MRSVIDAATLGIAAMAALLIVGLIAVFAPVRAHEEPAPLSPTSYDRSLIMALAEDILALLPKFQAESAAKDASIAALTAQVADLTKQIADGEAAVQTVANEIAPPAPVDPVAEQPAA